MEWDSSKSKRVPTGSYPKQGALQKLEVIIIANAMYVPILFIGLNIKMQIVRQFFVTWSCLIKFISMRNVIVSVERRYTIFVGLKQVSTTSPDSHRTQIISAKDWKQNVFKRSIIFLINHESNWRFSQGCWPCVKRQPKGSRRYDIGWARLRERTLITYEALIMEYP